MRTKTLLITAAVAAAGFVYSSMAQVYSVNQVGYVNVVLRGDAKFTLVANPLDAGDNSLTNLIGYLPNKSQVLTWNGVTFVGVSKAFGAWGSNPTLAPGTGFFVKNGDTGAPNVTNTFVGTVVPNPGNSVTNPVAAGFTLKGSIVPYAGDLTSDVNINLGPLLPNKSNLLKWDSAGQTYVGVAKAFGAWGGPLTVAVGEGFFINNGAAPTINWVETNP